MPFSQALDKGKYISISWFVTCSFYCLKIAPTFFNNSKFTKELEIFETVDGAKYAFHENWVYLQNFSNLRISEPPSNKI